MEREGFKDFVTTKFKAFVFKTVVGNSFWHIRDQFDLCGQVQVRFNLIFREKMVSKQSILLERSIL